MAYARTGSISRGADAQRAYAEALRQAEILEGIANREARISGRPPHYFAELLYALVYTLSDRPEAAAYISTIESAIAAGKLRPVILGIFRCLQGRDEDALVCFERILQQRQHGLNYLRVDPFLERFRGTPRFEALLRQLKLK